MNRKKAEEIVSQLAKYKEIGTGIFYIQDIIVAPADLEARIEFIKNINLGGDTTCIADEYTVVALLESERGSTYLEHDQFLKHLSSAGVV